MSCVLHQFFVAKNVAIEKNAPNQQGLYGICDETCHVLYCSVHFLELLNIDIDRASASRRMLLTGDSYISSKAQGGSGSFQDRTHIGEWFAGLQQRPSDPMAG